MGHHLNRARQHFGADTAGLLDGGRYALLHSRSLEFDDLRPYVPGDDVRDIDWKASARSGEVLIKRYVSEKHHKIVLVADAGMNMTALTPSGETKRDVAAAVMGAVGLITLGRADEIGMVYGDSRGSAMIRNRRGESHIEAMLDRFHRHTADPAASDLTEQLRYLATHYRHRMLVFVVSDEPAVTRGLDELLATLTARHDVLWAMVADMPAVGEQAGYDVATGQLVPSARVLGRGIAEAYRRAERLRRDRLTRLLTARGVPFAVIGGSAQIRSGLTAMTQVFARAG